MKQTKALLTSKWLPRIKDLKLQQKEFAILAGVTEAHLSMIVNQKISPNHTTIAKIENKLKELEASYENR